MYLIAFACWTLMQTLLQPGCSSWRDVPVPALIAKLDSKDPVERWEAAYELGLRGEEAVSAVPRLLEMLRKDADEDARIAAAYALARAGRNDKAVVPALVEAMKKDSQATVRFSAAAALGDVGASAKAAIPALAEALKDTDRNVRISAASSMGQIGPDEVANRALWKALEDKSVTVRVVAAASLLRGKPQKKAPFILIIGAFKREEDLKSEDEKEASFAAGGFLLSVNDKHGSMVPALVDALSDGDAHVRHCAAHTLGLIGQSAKEAIPALRKALKDDNDRVRDCAAQALEKIERR